MPTDPSQYKGRKVQAFPYDNNGRGSSVLVLPIVSGTDIVGYLPAKASDNGDGTATLETTAIFTGTLSSDVNIEKIGGTLQTGADWTPLLQRLDVDLSTRASEATLLDVLSKLDDILNKIDVVVVGEIPSGAINSSNVTFTTFFSFKPGTTQVYLNGVRQEEGAGNDYVEEVDHVTLTFAVAPDTGDTLIVDYHKQ